MTGGVMDRLAGEAGAALGAAAAEAEADEEADPPAAGVFELNFGEDSTQKFSAKKYQRTWKDLKRLFIFTLLQDLPTPRVHERRDPQPGRMQVPQGNPLLLSHTLQELLARDTVQVELIPEKKGLFLKHVEYEVSSQDVQNKLKESAQCVGDEFMNCKLAPRAKDFLPADIQTQLAVSRELIRNICNSFHRLRDRAERIASRAVDNAADLLVFGKELSALGSDTTPLPSWASLNSSTWGSLKQALRGLSVEFALLADKAAQQGKQEENDVVEKLNLFLDLLQSYKDLCERHEKGVLHKHQRALHKYSVTKRQMLSAAVQSREPDSAQPLESRIVEQENAIQTLELRSFFSLYCLHQEMQLVHIYLPLTSHILGAFVNSQIQGHKEMSKVWNDLKPKLSCLFAGPNSSLPPPRSPQDGMSPQ
ncbi:sorting nexin-8 isoform X5 [Mirounga angustirostris]|uniref:sorting nexin-8 isoform X5 n=1 Tax=Mirounga angustirostris TaxID=9716 RepID=UPI00313DA90A